MNRNSIGAADLLAAVCEGKIEAKALLREIELAISDYFTAETELNGTDLELSFPNGSRFKLTLEEI